jgi:hypothetical protein
LQTRLEILLSKVHGSHEGSFQGRGWGPMDSICFSIVKAYS